MTIKPTQTKLGALIAQEESPWLNKPSIDGAPIERTYIFNRPNVNPTEKYTFYSDNTPVERYRDFIAGTDNDSRLSAQQSWFERLGNGLAKNTLRTANVAAGTTIGVAASLLGGTDNSITRFLDDMNTWTDLNLPNYKDKQEREMNFWQSLGNLDFLMDDVGQGVSMVAGVVVGEALWSAIPGVGNAAATGAALRTMRNGDKLLKAGKGVSRFSLGSLRKLKGKNISEFVKLIGKSSSSGKQIIKGLERSTKAKGWAEALDYGRYVLTSSVYEAGMEEFHTKKEAIENFYSAYAQKGEKPSVEEEAAFFSEANKMGNFVFWSNIPLITIGNAATLGGMLGKQFPSKLGGNWIRKTLKNKSPIKHTFKGGKSVFSLPSVSKTSKALKTTWSYLNPLWSEGVVEEGGQGFVSNLALNYLESKFDPDSMDKTVSIIDGAGKAFREAYFSRDGFKEVGIGMLIGGIGHQVGVAKSTGKAGGFFKSSYAAERARNQTIADELNKMGSSVQKGLLTRAQLETARKLGNVNSILSANKQAEVAASKGDYRTAKMASEMAQFEYHNMMRTAGMEEVLTESMGQQIDAIKDSDLIEAGANAEQLQEVREQMKEEVSKQFDRNKKAFDIAEAIAPTAMSKTDIKNMEKIEGISMEDYTSLMALELSFGKYATENIHQVARKLTELTQIENLEDVFSATITMDYKYQEAIEEQKAKQQEISELEEELKSIQRGHIPTLEDAPTEVNSEVVEQGSREQHARYNEVLEALDKKRVELQEVESRIQGLKSVDNIKTNNPFWEFMRESEEGSPINFEDSQGEVDASSQTVSESLSMLDDYLASVNELLSSKELSTEERASIEQHAQEVSDAYQELRLNLESQRVMAENFALRSNPKYAIGTVKGIMNKMQKGMESRISEESMITEDNFEAVIEANKDKLSDSDIFKLRTHHRIIKNIKSLQNTALNSKPTNEVISRKDFDEYEKSNAPKKYEKFLPSIVSRLIGQYNNQGTPLSKRQEKIYQDFKKEIDKAVADITAKEGTKISEVSKREVFTINTELPFLEGVKDLIDRVLKNQRELIPLLPESFDKSMIPTKGDYELFQETLNDIRKTIEDGGTPDSEILELAEELREKINTWGVISGVKVGSGLMYLSDLFEIVSDLEANKVNPNAQSPTLIKLDDLTVDVEWAERPDGRKYAVGQMYDTGVVSTKGNIEGGKTFTIHNVSVGEFALGLGEDVTVKVGKKTYEKQDLEQGKLEGVDLRKNNAIVKFTIGGEQQTVVLNQDTLGNIEIKDSFVKESKVGNYLLKPVSEFQRNYQPLLKVNEDGSTTTVKSDFTFENGQRTINTEASKNVRQGDRLKMKVPLKDRYNIRLINEYIKALKSGDSATIATAKQSLTTNAIVYLMDGNGELVQILKKGADEYSKSSDDSAAAMEQLRLEIIGGFVTQLESENLSGELYDTGKTLKVAQVLPGFPNIKIQDLEGQYNVEFIPFDERATRAIDDIGYYEDGEFRTRSGKHDNEVNYPFMSAAVKKAEKGKRIPFVVAKVGRNRIAYPVRLANEVMDKSNELFELLQEEDLQLRARLINMFIIENGLDINELGVTGDTVNQESKIEKIIDASGSVTNYPNLDSWLDTENSMEEVLMRDALTNVDFSDNPFSAPKMVLDISGKYKGEVTQSPKLPSTTKIDSESKKIDPGLLKSSKKVSEAKANNFSNEEAIKLWQVAHTEGMAMWAKEQGIEQENPDNYTVRQVSDYMNAKFLENNKLNVSHVTSLYELLATSAQETFGELHEVLSKAFFKNGVRSVSEKSLRESGLYSEREINRILANPDLQNIIQDLTLMLGYELLNENSPLHKAQKTTLLEEAIVLESEVTSTGQGNMVSPEHIMKSLAERLGGVSTKSVLDSLMEAIEFDTIRDLYRNDAGFANYLFNLMSNLSIVQINRINSQGELVPQTDLLTEEQVTPTLTNGGKKGADTIKARELLDLIEYTVRELGDEWTDMGESIADVVKGIEEILSFYNIDVIGLSDKVFSQPIQNVIEIAHTAIKVAESTTELFPNEAAVSDFVGMYNQLFERTGETQYDYKSLPKGVNKVGLVRIDTTIDDATAFSQYRLVRVVGNLFKKASSQQTLDMVYEELYEKVRTEPTIVPKEALTGAMTPKTKQISIERLRDPNNKANVIKGLKTFHQKKAIDSNLIGEGVDSRTIEELAVYSTVFGTQMATKAISGVTDVQRVLSVKGDVTNLETQFPIAFKQFVLQEKMNNTPLYDKVLRYFDFTDRGVEFVAAEPFTAELAKLAMSKTPIYEQFNNYALLSKNPSISQLANVNENIQIDELSEGRINYVNNPQLLNEYTGFIGQEAGFVVSELTSDLFIKHNGRVYEKIRDLHTDGTSIFQPLNYRSSDSMLITEVSRPSVVKMDINELAGKYGVIENTGVVGIRKPTNKESKKLDNELKDCK